MKNVFMFSLICCVLSFYPLFALHIDDLTVNETLDKSQVAALFVDAESGKELFSYNSDAMWIPASNAKLFTTSAALYYLGEDYTYKTTVYTNGVIEDGILEGDLIIKGTGDPSISARFFPDSDDPRIVFFNWSEELSEKGVSVITGDIIADDRHFDDQYFHPAWYPRSRGAWYQAEVAALSFNDNCVDLRFTGGSSPGETARFSLSPPTRYVEINNHVTTTASNEWGPSFQRNDRANYINATGTVGLNRQRTGYASVYHPPLYFVTVLAETLDESGIEIQGSPLSIRDIENTFKYEQGLTTLIEYTSPPLSELIYVINQRSQNLFAELLLKTLGKEVLGEGSFEKGGQVIDLFLKNNDLYHPDFVMVDGSGLSNRHRVSPEMVVNLLRYQRTRDDWNVFFDSLPQGGRTGSLRSRFRNSQIQRELGQYVYGKTGYINQVVTLSGVITGHETEDIVYSIFLNNFSCSAGEARIFADQVAVKVLNHIIDTQSTRASHVQ